MFFLAKNDDVLYSTCDFGGFAVGGPGGGMLCVLESLFHGVFVVETVSLDRV